MRLNVQVWFTWETAIWNYRRARELRGFRCIRHSRDDFVCSTQVRRSILSILSTDMTSGHERSHRQQTNKKFANVETGYFNRQIYRPTSRHRRRRNYGICDVFGLGIPIMTSYFRDECLSVICNTADNGDYVVIFFPHKICLSLHFKVKIFEISIFL